MEEQIIKNFLRKILKTEDDIDKLDNNEDLRGYGLNSIRVVELILEIEEEFKIEITEDYLVIENFITIDKILEMIHKIQSVNKVK